MTTGLAVALMAAATGLALTALASAAETVLAIAARVSIRDLVGRGAWRDQAMERLLDRPVRTWATLTVMQTTGLLLAGAGGMAVTERVAPSPGVAAILMAVYAVLAVAVFYLVPRMLAGRHSQLVAFLVATPVHGAALVLYPAVAPVAWLARRTRRNGTHDLGAGSALLRGDDMRLLVEGGEDDGLLEQDEREMIAGIFELGDTKVREVMVPRIDVVAIPEDSGLDEALDTILRAGHSRIPVYRESIDDIAGLLYAKDLLKAFRDRDFNPKLLAMLREAYFVPESKPVDELLAELQSRKVHMAIVVDEYGGTAGLVTIEDLIEEIVGEIQDEYDVEESRIELLSDDEGLFHAGVDIDDVNRLMDIQLPTDDVDTLAGLVFTRLGKVPEVGELAEFDDARIEVLSVTDRRIQRVRVTRQFHYPGGEAEGAADPDQPRDGDGQVPPMVTGADTAAPGQ